jgi:hypothetical protein
MGTIRIASNMDSPSFNLVICKIRKVYQIKTSANIYEGPKNFFYRKIGLTQNPAVLRNKRSMEYVNQLCS